MSGNGTKKHLIFPKINDKKPSFGRMLRKVDDGYGVFNNETIVKVLIGLYSCNISWLAQIRVRKGFVHAIRLGRGYGNHPQQTNKKHTAHNAKIRNTMKCVCYAYVITAIIEPMKRLIILASIMTSSLYAQLDYVMPMYKAVVMNYGLKYDRPVFNVNGNTLLETTLSKADELQIKMPNPVLEMRDSTYKVQMGFVVYDYKDSLLGIAPDLYNGRTLTADIKLDALTFTLKFKGIKADSAVIKLVIFGKDAYSMDSFSISMRLTVLEREIYKIPDFKNMSYIYTRSVNKADELTLSTGTKLENIKWLVNKGLPELQFTLEDKSLENIKLRELYALDKNGQEIWRINEKDAELEWQNGKYSLKLKKKSKIPQSAVIIGW